MDLQEIDNHVEAKFNADAAAKLDICAIYLVARPIISFAAAILFFKPKWQQVLQALIASLDAQCPS